MPVGIGSLSDLKLLHLSQNELSGRMRLLASIVDNRSSPVVAFMSFGCNQFSPYAFGLTVGGIRFTTI